MENFQLICFFLGALMMAIMDFVHFQFPLDKGYWSIHTKGSKSDAWHHSKKLGLLFFALGIIGTESAIYTLVYILNHPLFWMAVAAYTAQKFYHLLKVFKK